MEVSKTYKLMLSLLTILIVAVTGTILIYFARIEFHRKQKIIYFDFDF